MTTSPGPARGIAVLAAALSSLLLGAAFASPQDPVQDPGRAAAGIDRADIDYDKQIQPLLAEFCFRCHGERRQKGDVRLDALDPAMPTRADAEGWHSALDMINGAEMPPDDEPQMSDEQRRLIVKWMTDSLAAAAQRQAGERRITMRRLTRQQYTNSLQEVLGVTIDFGDVLPADARSKTGFSNNGEVLQASSLHLDYYQQLARTGLDQAIAVGDRPEVTHYRVTFGRDIGKNLVAGHTGGYQSVPLSTNDFTVEILDADGQPLTGGDKASQRQIDSTKKRISVGLRGSGQDRFRVVDEGMILLSALPHREKVPQAWQGPSPNLKLEMQRCWPERGDFVMRVRASRGYVPPLRKQILVRLDDPIALAGIDGER